MTISQSSLVYLKQKFTTKKQIDDYIDLVKKIHLMGQTQPIDRPYGYRILVDQGGFQLRPELFVSATNHWLNNEPPTIYQIISPDPTDELWVKVRKAAVSAAIINTAAGRRGYTPSDQEIIRYLKKWFDGSISSDNIALDSPLLNKAWTQFYEKNRIGTSAPGYGTSLFGNWFALGVYIDYAIARLQTFDPVGGTVQPGTGGSEPDTNEDVEEDYALRYTALEEFLQHTNPGYGNPILPTVTAGVFNHYAIKNGVSIFDPSLPPPENFSIFQKIFAPSKDSKILTVNIKYQKNIFEKIEVSGLLDLLVQSDQIRQFGRDRFENEESVKASAAKVVKRNKRYWLASSAWINSF